jgi:hypothetical protein
MTRAQVALVRIGLLALLVLGVLVQLAVPLPGVIFVLVTLVKRSGLASAIKDRSGSVA